MLGIIILIGAVWIGSAIGLACFGVVGAVIGGMLALAILGAMS